MRKVFKQLLKRSTILCLLHHHMFLYTKHPICTKRTKIYITYNINMGDIPFEILPKTSASMSIIVLIKHEGSQYVLKVWSYENKHTDVASLDYEIKVYKKINNVMRQDQTLPFVKMLRSDKKVTVRDLGVGIGINNKEHMRKWLVVFSFFLTNQGVKFPYSDTDINKIEQDNPDIESFFVHTKNHRLNFIALPFIVHRTFSSVLNDASTEDIENIIVKLVTGIHAIYNAGIVHNDLHAGNIMVTNDNKPLIFDWDRGYIKGKTIQV